MPNLVRQLPRPVVHEPRIMAHELVVAHLGAVLARAHGLRGAVVEEAGAESDVGRIHRVDGWAGDAGQAVVRVDGVAVERGDDAWLEGADDLRVRHDAGCVARSRVAAGDLLHDGLHEGQDAVAFEESFVGRIDYPLLALLEGFLEGDPEVVEGGFYDGGFVTALGDGVEAGLYNVVRS